MPEYHSHARIAHRRRTLSASSPASSRVVSKRLQLVKPGRMFDISVQSSRSKLRDVMDVPQEVDTQRRDVVENVAESSAGATKFLRWPVLNDC